MRITVEVTSQTLILWNNGTTVARYKISTAANGVGNRQNSNCTPLGKHRIYKKCGAGLPIGAVLSFGEWTGAVIDQHNPPQQGKDYILTRALILEGVEPGINRGPGIDSLERGIFIHGTQAEDKLGTPVSHGCVRMGNKDIMALFEQVDEGDEVVILP